MNRNCDPRDLGASARDLAAARTGRDRVWRDPEVRCDPHDRVLELRQSERREGSAQRLRPLAPPSAHEGAELAPSSREGLAKRRKRGAQIQ